MACTAVTALRRDDAENARLALLLLPWTLAGYRWPAVTVPLGALLAVTMLVIAVMTGRSGFSGRVVEAPGLAGAYWLWILSPNALLVTVVAGEWADPPAGVRWRLWVAVLVSATAPLGEFFIAGALLGSSDDSTPWSEAVSGPSSWRPVSSCGPRSAHARLRG